MKFILYNFVYFIIILFCFIFIINSNSFICNKVLYSVDLWLKNLVPVLFPTFILIDFINSTNLPKVFSKLFKVNYVFLLSIFSGSPSNVLMMNNVYDVKILAFTKYISFIFLFKSLSNIFNCRIAICLIVLNVLCNFILCIIFKVNCSFVYNKNKFNLSNSIVKSFNVLLNILGTIIFFNIIPLYLINNVYIESFILAFMEVSSSFNNILLSKFSYHFKLLLSIITISFGGFAIDMQIKSIIGDTSINYKSYYFYKLLHLILYTILVILILF